MYRVIWDDNGLSPPGHFQNANPVDNRPVEIDADKYEIEASVGGYLVINFFKEDVLITTLFRTPIAVVPVADIQE